MTELPTLSMSAIADIESKINYHFVNRSLLFQAFTRSSYCNEQAQITGVLLPSNEVLEFCGDSVLGAAVMTLLIRANATMGESGLVSRFDEGDYSTVKSRLSDKSMLSQRMADLGFQKYLFMSRGDREQRIYETPSVMEDLFESLLGAVYLDSGDFSKVVQVVSELLDPGLYLQRTGVTKNAKNRLQELCQAKKQLCEYRELSVTGPENETVYTVAVYLNGEETATGQGRSKKKAEMAAAEEACRLLEAEMGQSDAVASAEVPGESPVALLKEWDDHNGRRVTFSVTESTPITVPPQFRAAYFQDGRLLSEGIGYSKRDAKRLAAETAIARLRQDGLWLADEKEGEKS